MEVILNKQQAIEIAISLIKGDKVRKDYGSSALRESELILKNILDSTIMEKEAEKTQAPPRTILDLEKD
tara:strand:+ start:320 stop:526 length:207 start_codon:yes stop_codon:yes gene_type:complete